MSRPAHQHYRQRGEGEHLLHGVLHIKIICAKGLHNTDGLLAIKYSRKKEKGGGMGSALGKLKRNLSDPFVSVFAGNHRLCKTSIIDDNLNPVWNEEFYCYVGHYVKSIKFEVKDMDFGMRADLLGKHLLPVTKLIRYDNDTGQPMRVGMHMIATLDSTHHKKNGTLEYFIEFVPKEMLTPSPEVPGVYFNVRCGNDVKLYCNADDGAEGLPAVTYGGPDDNEMVWTPQRLWRDMYDAICAAQDFIYVTGWSVDTTQSLLRGREKDEALQSPYSPYIGELLRQKSEEGVRVNMLVWDDSTSNANFKAIMPGMMGTHDEETNTFFKSTDVTCVLAPMLGDETNAIHEKAGKFVMFTHHQKLVILDSPSVDPRSDKKEPLAFVGGLDLTNGRWDNHLHPLFRTLQSDHKNDAYCKCFPVDVDNVGPRQPWRDIHSCVRGPGVLDVLENFRERWINQAKREISKLLDMGRDRSLSQFVEAGLDPRKVYGGWCTQLFRSIDARTATFQEFRKGQAHVEPESCDDWLGSFHGEDMESEAAMKEIRTYDKFKSKAKGKLGARADMLKKGKDKAKGKLGMNFSDPENLGRAFARADINTFRYMQTLHIKKGREVDDSVHKGLVHHIRRAEHCLYIESQYFLGSAHCWSHHEDAKCNNLIPSEITLKILEKIELGERFAAYIVLPMWPEGIPEGGAVQQILYWQRYTIEYMYKTISKALSDRRNAVRDGSQRGTFSAEDIAAHPTDYLNFYCLATRETSLRSEAAHEPHPNNKAEQVLEKTRRHQIYVHSKMAIVDDSVAIVGSANVNQRSLDGARDSEVLLGSYQPAHMADKHSIPHGDVHGFRMHCWATTLCKFEEVFRRPSSLECVRRVNAIAEENWRTYTDTQTRDMNSYLVPYPIQVQDDGSIRVRPDLKDGCFPDTKAKIFGTKSMTIPEILAT